MKIKKYIPIILAALLSRWLVFVIGWITSGSGTDFFRAVYDAFSKAGDTPHYLEIAKNGYTAVGENAKLIVFFPLYPLLIKIIAVITRSYFAAGLAVSNICTAVGACYFYELMRLDFDEEHSCFALFGLLLFPFSFFTSAVYTEGLFLLLTCASLYYMRKNRYIAAGICAFLCSLTRIQGLALMFVFLYEMFESEDKCLGTAAAASAAGFFVYILINKAVYGEWFKYIEYQAAEPWYNKAQWIGKNLEQHYQMAKDYPELAMYIYYPQLILFFAGVGAMLFGIKKRVRASYIVYAGAYIAMTYFHGWQISGGRYMSMCVPLFAVFAVIENRLVKGVVLMGSALMFTILGIMWFRGYAIM